MRGCFRSPVRAPAEAALAVGLVLAAGGAFAEVPGRDRQAELMHLLRQDCGSCHGMTMKGGLGSPLLPETLRDKPDDTLIDVILDGRPGTPMPPWRFELSSADAAWLVRRLKEGLDRP